ncbi:MAG: sigma-70 family RNA polymerase sigma factor [Phycisphaerales bacterium]|nr:MAG: sigma-70 family RNA polymerase sigma factor [Phycisphaerales bacterium]
MPSEAYELVLVGKAVGGDPVALTVLLTQARGRLRNHVTRRIPADLRGTIDADDVLQDAQVQAYSHIAHFVPQGPDSFYRWFATIAIRRLRNAVERHRALKRGGGRLARAGAARAGVPEESCVALLDLLAAPVKTPSRTAAGREAVQAVQAALAFLPEDYRQAVQLVYIEGQPVAAAAAKMGRTERAIHNLCYKAKDRLRKLMGSRSRYLSSSG